MRTVVVNLTRFGDLLQTQPVFSELKAAGRETALVCLDNFSGAARLLRDVDRIFPLEGARYLARLDASWTEAVAAVWEFRREIARNFPDARVVNLTPAVSARVFGRFLASGPVTGFGLDHLGFREDSNPWGPFLEASSANRGLSPFNLVDLFRKTAGLGQGRGVMRLAEPEPEAESAAGAILAQAPGEARGFVAFQMGASAERRRWPVDFFASLARMLWEKRGAVPILLGSKAEAALGEEFASLAQIPAIDAIGRTGLPELAALIRRTSLLVSNDTGTMHLAAGLGVPCAAIFLATAQPFDTGPYLPGCLCLEPDMPCHPCPFGAPCPNEYACRRAITPETVFSGLDGFFERGSFAKGAYQGARAWLSVAEDSGFAGLVSLSGHEKGDRFKWITAQRLFFRQFLDETPPDLSPLAGSMALGPQAALEIRELLSTSRSLLLLLSHQGAGLLRAPREAAKVKFLASWRRLRDLWLASPYFSILGHLWTHLFQESDQDFGRILGLIDRFSSLTAALDDALAPGK